jgi:hypothetical protein
MLRNIVKGGSLSLSVCAPVFGIAMLFDRLPGAAAMFFAMSIIGTIILFKVSKEKW